jgi:hypothetical protein
MMLLRVSRYKTHGRDNNEYAQAHGKRKSYRKRVVRITKTTPIAKAA